MFTLPYLTNVTYTTQRKHRRSVHNNDNEFTTGIKTFDLKMATFSKMSEEDVFHVYRAAYFISIPWDDILDPELADWMTNYELVH